MLKQMGCNNPVLYTKVTRSQRWVSLTPRAARTWQLLGSAEPTIQPPPLDSHPHPEVPQPLSPCALPCSPADPWGLPGIWVSLSQPFAEPSQCGQRREANACSALLQAAQRQEKQAKCSSEAKRVWVCSKSGGSRRGWQENNRWRKVKSLQHFQESQLVF